MLDLEARVAALEARLAEPPPLIPEMTGPPLTGEQMAKLEADLGEAIRNPRPLKVLPPRPLLTPETARELAREYLTIVQPGETLLIRVPDGWTAQQGYETQRRIREIVADLGLGFTVLLVPGEEFAVARGEAA